MKSILIATGIFPPEIGGPALYSQKLAEEFSHRGIEIKIITYTSILRSIEVKGGDYQVSGVSRKWPLGIRQLIYFLKLLNLARRSEVILAFDSLGAGLPAALAGRILGKKVVIRLGGDFLWEKFIETGQDIVALTEFYEKRLYKKFSLLHRLITFALRQATVVFTTKFQKDLFIPNYGLNPGKVLVIGNVFALKVQPPLGVGPSGPKIILWAGRFLKLKNLDFLLRVFKKLLAYDKNLVLELAGEGPEFNKLKAESEKLKVNDKVLFLGNLDQSKVLEEIKKSYFCILPSLTEISPNFALHCLSLNKPIILTQETGIKEQFPGLMYADPKKEDSFFTASLRLLDKNVYDNYQKFISDIHYQKTWQDLVNEYLYLLE